MWINTLPHPSTLFDVGMLQFASNCGALVKRCPAPLCTIRGPSSPVAKIHRRKKPVLGITPSTTVGPSTRQFQVLPKHCVEKTPLRSTTKRSDSVVPHESLICSPVKDAEDNSSEAWLVDEVTTPFNQISVIEIGSEADHEFAGAYVLKLDDRDLVHSVYWPHDRRVWTGAYYDEFTILPALLPPGPIAILGLGAGTVARLLQHVWPSRRLEGWEIDPEVVRVGRAYFGLADLEGSGQREDNSSRRERTHPVRKGKGISRPTLVVHVGDALKERSLAEGRFAGMIVDLYSNGRICEGLKDRSVWAILRRRLLPGGRVMVNCGGPPVANGKDEVDREAVLETEEWRMGLDATFAALTAAFDGEINVKQLKGEGGNVMVLSGGLPFSEKLSVATSFHFMNGILDWGRHSDWHCRGGG